MVAFAVLWALGSAKEYLDQEALVCEFPPAWRVARIALWPAFALVWMAMVLWDMWSARRT